MEIKLKEIDASKERLSFIGIAFNNDKAWKVFRTYVELPYDQNSVIRINKRIYLRPTDNEQATYVPSGELILNNGFLSMHCYDGYLHNAAGEPAISTTDGWPVKEYYIDGRYFNNAGEYFTFLEQQRLKDEKTFNEKYPEYDMSKYIEFVAKTLGSKKLQ